MTVEREFTLRSVCTGILLGIALTPSNVYAGLKIGWSFNMSIIALLVGYGIWQGLGARLSGGRNWTIHESNISQTTASAAASIVSGGLVAPLPAYTLLTGQALPPLAMMVWVFAVSFLGIWIAWFLRPALVRDASLTFPEAVATLETLRDVYSHGKAALQRLAVLCASALFAAAFKGIDLFLWKIPRWSPSARLEQLTFQLDPSLLLLGFGGIIGLRVGVSLLIGGCIAWGVVAPWLIASGRIVLPPGSTGPQFAALIEWLLWPGVSLMVSATLTTLFLSLLSLQPGSRQQEQHGRSRSVPAIWTIPAIPALGLLSAMFLIVLLQMTVFGIRPLIALLTVPSAILLAAVAARIVGATGIPPIGAIGQLSQLGFGMVAPGQVGINLMSANTAGGAAGQCTDLMNDFRVGHAIGATPSRQTLAQCLGIAVGSVVGVAAYLALIPDPAAMLLTPDWPAPAVATWKAVAQTLTHGLESLAPDIRIAILSAALAGVAFGMLDAWLPERARARLPSGAAIGLAFVLPASTSLVMAAGALLAWLISRGPSDRSAQFTIAASAGLIAGESSTGIGASIWQLLKG